MPPSCSVRLLYGCGGGGVVCKRKPLGRVPTMHADCLASLPPPTRMSTDHNPQQRHTHTGMCAVPLGVAMRLIPIKEDPDNFGGACRAVYLHHSDGCTRAFVL